MNMNGMEILGLTINREEHYDSKGLRGSLRLYWVLRCPKGNVLIMVKTKEDLIHEMMWETYENNTTEEQRRA